MVKTPLEDFTTEILAGILANNKELRNDFINEILCVEGDNFEINTQQRFLLNEVDCPNCRVDLVVKSEDSICLVENKVESREGYIQLDRYSKVLDGFKAGKKTYLRYCTKYYDDKSIVTHDFLQFRWADVYKFLKKHENIPLIKEYLEFLKTHNMSDELDFTLKDLVSLQEMNQVIKKLDGYLDKIKPSFNKIFGFYAKDSVLLKQVKEHSRYSHFLEVPFGVGYSELAFGFKFTDTPCLTVWIWCSDKNTQKVEFKRALNKQDLKGIGSNKENWLGMNKPISDFLSDANMEEAIVMWFVNAFSLIKKFAEDNPQLEWHVK